MSNKVKNILPCYFAFMVNGMLALVAGAMLPYLIIEAKISYSVAGGLLSAFAIGNLLASFVVPSLMAKVGRKRTTVMLAGLIPIFLFVITLVPSVHILYMAFLLPGLGRGTISITNNMVLTENDNRPSAMNLLHTMFAFGAFVTPFLTVIFVGTSFGWRGIVYTIIVLSTISIILFELYLQDVSPNKRTDIEEVSEILEDAIEATIEAGETKIDDTVAIVQSSQRNTHNEKHFLKNINFYVIGMILFFYLGVENCVNGWFITYFKTSGIMSDAYAANLVSITWFLIMLGRLFTAYISRKVAKHTLILVNCLFATACFFLLISTQNLVLITVSVVGIGFFFAGIYPTCISNASEYIKGSTAGMSLLLAMAATGGILMPQMVGVLADIIGMSGAIGFLMIGVTCMLVCAIINLLRHKKRSVA